MEEFSFVNPLCFFDVIVPLLMKRFVAFIGITTVSSELDNFVNDFIRRKVFYHVEYTMVCPPCRRAGKEESCDHYEYKTPPWLTKEGQEFTKKIYGEQRVEQFAREGLGIVKVPTMNCFDMESVHRLFDKARVPLSRVSEYLFITIDPCGGSMKPDTSVSQLALCSHAVPGYQMVGAEGIFVAKPEDYEDRIINHIHMCRRNPFLTNARIVVFIENNLALEASHLRKLIKDHFPRAVFPNETDDVKDGLKTSKESKAAMAMMTARLLREDQLSISKDFVTTDANPAGLLEALRKQLLRYSKLTIPSKDPYGNTRISYSGKGLNMKDMDDLAIAFQMDVYLHQQFLGMNPKFLRYQL